MQGSAGNVIAALASFFVPGLGQLLQGRVFAALMFFIFTCALYFILIGFFVHLWAILNAAMYQSPYAANPAYR
jgi:TM2 domain-containing membrane protein YozV